MEDRQPIQPSESACSRWPLGLILAATTVFALLLSHVTLLWEDELFSFYTATQPSAAAIIHLQLHTPFALDPLAYPLASHAAMALFGQNAFALRLPSLLGFLLMQLCIFHCVRLAFNARTAYLAALLPLCMSLFDYTAQGRPYGMLLGEFGAVLLCWYLASSREHRMLPLLGLAIALFAAITTHFFGVLILVPVFCAEVYRAIVRRKVDAPLLLAIAIGMSGLLADLPVRAAVLPYRAHFYSATNLHANMLGYSYVWAFGQFFRYLAHDPQHGIFWPVWLLLGTVLALSLRETLLHHRNQMPLWVALATLGLLPFFAMATAMTATNAYEPRYALGLAIGFSALLAIALAPLLQRTWFFYALLFCIWGSIVPFSFVAASQQAAVTAAQRSALQNFYPPGPVYMAAEDCFSPDYFYATAAERGRIICLYSTYWELRQLQNDTGALTSQAMNGHTPLHFLDFAQYPAKTAPGTLWIASSHPTWLNAALREQGFSLVPVRSGATGTLYRLQ